MIKYLYKTKRMQTTFNYTYEIGSSLDPLTRNVLDLIINKPTIQLKTLLEEVGLIGDLATFVERRFSSVMKGFNRNTTFNSYKNKEFLKRVFEEEAMIELEDQKFVMDVYEDLGVIRVNGDLITMPDNLRRFVSQHLQTNVGVKGLKNVSEGYPEGKVEFINVGIDFKFNGQIEIDGVMIEVKHEAYNQIARQLKKTAFNAKEFDEPQVNDETIDCKVLTKEALKQIFEEEVLYNGWKEGAKDGVITISTKDKHFKSTHLLVWNKTPLFYEKVWQEKEIITNEYKDRILEAAFLNNKLVDSLTNSLVLDLINKYAGKNINMINNIVNRRPLVFEDIEIAKAIFALDDKKSFNFTVGEENIIRILQNLPAEIKKMFMSSLNKNVITSIEDQWIIKFIIENHLSKSLLPKQIKKYESWSKRQDDMLDKYFEIIRKITETGINNEKLELLSSKELNKLKINKQFKKWINRNIENPKGEAFKRIIQPPAITKAKECLVIANKWVKFIDEIS
ncbi:hypothetical protein [Mycoplasma todarodis]|uniref:Uncharacterized protein n=1 Tax=Mycoplasma todarodis TaxID=1937191 RepID=A0A4R0XSI4_9MOLU|nr:hypothetical protein [Mycoplasma todarodis]TCG11839.1 hypothetical protein C4B25_00780 [Mycoplasma todarodis]